MIIAIIIVVLVLYVISVQHRLVRINENISHAMNQINVQLSSRLDALHVLLALTEKYCPREYQPLSETAKSLHSITSASSPKNIQEQEQMINKLLRCITILAEKSPELKTDENYLRCMAAMDNYEKMFQTSRLIYNDHVNRLNRELQMLPSSVVAGVFGIHKKEYLEQTEFPTLL